MGAWGMAPFENDDFGDFQSAVSRAASVAIIKQVRVAIQSAGRDPREKWAAIGVIIVAYQSTYLDRDEVWPLAQEAQNFWNDLSADDEFLSSWRNPKAFRKMFEAVGEEIDDMVESYGKHQRKIVQLMFDDLEKDGHKGALPRRRSRR